MNNPQDPNLLSREQLLQLLSSCHPALAPAGSQPHQSTQVMYQPYAHTHPVATQPLLPHLHGGVAHPVATQPLLPHLHGVAAHPVATQPLLPHLHGGGPLLGVSQNVPGQAASQNGPISPRNITLSMHLFSFSVTNAKMVDELVRLGKQGLGEDHDDSAYLEKGKELVKIMTDFMKEEIDLTLNELIDSNFISHAPKYKVTLDWEQRSHPANAGNARRWFGDREKLVSWALQFINIMQPYDFLTKIALPFILSVYFTAEKGVADGCLEHVAKASCQHLGGQTLSIVTLEAPDNGRKKHSFIQHITSYLNSMKRRNKVMMDIIVSVCVGDDALRQLGNLVFLRYCRPKNPSIGPLTISYTDTRGNDRSCKVVYLSFPHFTGNDPEEALRRMTWDNGLIAVSTPAEPLPQPLPQPLRQGASAAAFRHLTASVQQQVSHQPVGAFVGASVGAGDGTAPQHAHADAHYDSQGGWSLSISDEESSVPNDAVVPNDAEVHQLVNEMLEDALEVNGTVNGTSPVHYHQVVNKMVKDAVEVNGTSPELDDNATPPDSSTSPLGLLGKSEVVSFDDTTVETISSVRKMRTNELQSRKDEAAARRNNKKSKKRMSDAVEQQRNQISKDTIKQQKQKEKQEKEKEKKKQAAAAKKQQQKNEAAASKKADLTAIFAQVEEFHMTCETSIRASGCSKLTNNGDCDVIFCESCLISANRVLSSNGNGSGRRSSSRGRTLSEKAKSTVGAPKVSSPTIEEWPCPCSNSCGKIGSFKPALQVGSFKSYGWTKADDSFQTFCCGQELVYTYTKNTAKS
eukprot:scaffold4112_cov91-Skeletonema_menzelii.AAC.1